MDKYTTEDLIIMGIMALVSLLWAGGAAAFGLLLVG
jgi:hypothetical protein